MMRLLLFLFFSLSLLTLLIGQMNNKESTVVLLNAAAQGDLEVLKRAIKQYAEVEAFDEKSGLNSLMYAAHNNHVLVMKELVKVKVKLDTLSKDGNKTALLMASFQGHVESVEFLISSGAKIDKVNKRGDTSLSLGNFHLNLSPQNNIYIRHVHFHFHFL